MEKRTGNLEVHLEELLQQVPVSNTKLPRMYVPYRRIMTVLPGPTCSHAR